MILFFGDVHSDFSHVLPLVEQHQPAAIIFLGDLEATAPLDQVLARVTELTEVWWIPGNHDTDSLDRYHNLYGCTLTSHNLHGQVVEIAGLRIAGLGGIFRGAIWYPRETKNVRAIYTSYNDAVRSLMSAELAKIYRANQGKFGAIDEVDPPLFGKGLLHKSTIFPDVWQLLSAQKADILVCHEAPSCHQNGFVGIDELARSMGVKWLFHGHQHDRLDYRNSWQRMGFRAFGVGFREVMDLDGNVLRSRPLSPEKDQER